MSASPPNVVAAGCYRPPALHVNLDKLVAFEIGSRFAIREGGKTVGSCVVTEILA